MLLDVNEPRPSKSELTQQSNRKCRLEIVARCHGRVDPELYTGGNLNQRSELRPPECLNDVLISKGRIAGIRPGKSDSEQVFLETKKAFADYASICGLLDSGSAFVRSVAFGGPDLSAIAVRVSTLGRASPVRQKANP